MTRSHALSENLAARADQLIRGELGLRSVSVTTAVGDSAAIPDGLAAARATGQSRPRAAPAPEAPKWLSS